MVTGWKTATVKETSTIFGRIGFRGYTKEDIVDAYEGAISLSPSNLKDGKVDITNSTFISWDKYNESPEIKLQDGDVVLVKTGSTYGKSAYVDNLKWATTLNPQIVVFKNVKINKKLFAYFVQTPEFQKQIEATIVGGAIPTLSQNQVYQFEITFPIDVGEQQRIAEALSDVDSMISALEKLIAKKKTVKQGAMQELLTGKKRLPGFDGEWNKINLAKKSKIKARIGWQGLTTNEYLDSGYSYLVTGTDFVNGKIDWDNCHYVAKDRFDQDKNIQIQNDDILITKDGSLGKTALVKGLDKPATLNSGVFVIRPIQESYDPVFVYYILSSFVFKDFLDHLSAGSTIIHLYQKDISKFEFLIPPTIEEQTAIASILSDMDNEIEALEQKLEKTRQIKQGMMQQLLTGKIRLV